MASQRVILGVGLAVLLIVSAAVRGAQVEGIVGLQILLDPKSDAGEPTRFPTGSRRQSASRQRQYGQIQKASKVPLRRRTIRPASRYATDCRKTRGLFLKVPQNGGGLLAERRKRADQAERDGEARCAERCDERR